MDELKARQEIVKYSHKVQQYGYVSATDGNLSIRLSENQILITPHGLAKGDMTLEDPIIVNMRGEKISGAGGASSETKMHLRVFQLRSDVTGVIHAHPPKCIAFTLAGVPLDTCQFPEVAVTIGQVPTSPYATPTTEEVPTSIEPLIQNNDAIMLARHGSLTVGRNLGTAFTLLEKMEHTATISLYARLLGGIVPFTRDELTKLYELRPSWGVDRPLPECPYPRPGTQGHSPANEQRLTNRDGHDAPGLNGHAVNGLHNSRGFSDATSENAASKRAEPRLTDEEMEQLIEKIVQAVARRLGG